jgi:hypothetical protein
VELRAGEGQLRSLAAYFTGKESFTCNKHWIYLNLNLSLMKQQFIVTHPAQFYRTQKKTRQISRPTLGHVTFL